MDRFTSRLAQWVFYLAATLYFIAVLLRTILIYQGTPVLGRGLVLLLVGLVLFISEPVISRRWAYYFPIYLLLQTALVFVLLSLQGYSDFYATLLGILSIQALLNLNPKIGGAWIGACAIMIGVLLQPVYGSQAIALALIYTAANIFLGAYALVIRREQAAQEQKLKLARELQETNQQLQDYSTQLEQLAVARERNRFARELHDSVTQTVFSMNLTTQSALLLLERDPSRVKDQLEHLSHLVRSALAEMQALISSLKPEDTSAPRLVSALRQHLAEPRIAESLSVSLEVEGESSLTIAEEQALLGILQEALNNILKHAHTNQVQVRLHLAEPSLTAGPTPTEPGHAPTEPGHAPTEPGHAPTEPGHGWVEIEDHGVGFNLEQPRGSGRMGLIGMRERAAEIGWELQIITSPGAGTRIRVEKMPVREEQT